MLKDTVKGIIVVLLMAYTFQMGALYHDTKQEVQLCSFISCG